MRPIGDNFTVWRSPYFRNLAWAQMMLLAAGMKRSIALFTSLSLLAACVVDDEDPSTGATPIGGAETPEQKGQLGFDPGEGSCMPSEAMDHFGLCVCDSFDDVGQLNVLRAGAGIDASVGVNGETQLVSFATIEGSWHGYQGFHAVAQAELHGDLITTGDFSWVGRQTIGGDLSVGGDVEGVGSLSIGGELAVGGEMQVVGDIQSAGEDAYAAPAGPPCPCEGDDFFDVAAAVEDARAANDNAAIGLSPEGVSDVGETLLTLPTGRFYIASLEQVGELKIHVEGNAALYVDGDIHTVGQDSLTFAGGATLDLYVAGTVATVGQVSLGTAEHAADFRLLIGGGDAVQLAVGQQRFYGHIYAPTATLSYVGDTEIHGSLFAHRLEGVGQMTISHVSATVPPDEVCEGEAGTPR